MLVLFNDAIIHCFQNMKTSRILVYRMIFLNDSTIYMLILLASVIKIIVHLYLNWPFDFLRKRKKREQDRIKLT